MAPKLTRLTRSYAGINHATTIDLMRATLADFQAMTEQTMATVASTREALRAADVLLGNRSLSAPPRQPTARW